MNAEQLREKNTTELQDELLGLAKERFNLRMQSGSGQLPTHHQLRIVRKNIARVKTVMREKAKAES